LMIFCLRYQYRISFCLENSFSTFLRNRLQLLGHHNPLYQSQVSLVFSASMEKNAFGNVEQIDDYHPI
ncbi:MAG: hypothetical protein ACYTXY_51915, partial [Nostoc sp.]